MAKNSEKFYMGNQNLPSKGTVIAYTPEQAKEMQKCAKNILHFAEKYFYILNVDKGKIPIELYKAQKRVLKQMMENRFFCLVASRQVGKALALDTPIKTPSGWTTMGDLKTGDTIYGSDGQPCKVTHAHEIRYDRNCYEVEFDNGEKIIADEDHNWFTQTKSERNRKTNNRGSVKTTKEIFDTLASKAGEPNHRIPSCIQGLTGCERDLTIPPYVLGLWLGDGANDSSRITVGNRDIEETLENLKPYTQYKIVHKKWKSGCNGINLGMLSGRYGMKKETSLQQELREAGLLNNKHIPANYMLSSREQRLELLKGLMDSDGYINPVGTAIFYNTNLRLANDVKELIESLGYKTTYKTFIPTLYGNPCAECAEITFTPRELVCKLSFKASRIKINDIIQHESNKRNQWHYIKNIKQIPSVPVRCISVDSPDKLFLAGKTLIPTHNSTLMTIYILWMANFFENQRILLVANKESTAIEIFSRVRMAYEMLPNWLKSPVLEYAKTSMELENNSRIAITTTTGTAARGQSVSVLIIDEAAFIECVDGDTSITVKDGEKVKNMSVLDLYRTLVNEDDDITTNSAEYKILSDCGWKKFKGVIKKQSDNCVSVRTQSGKNLIVSKTHKFFSKSNRIITANSSFNKFIKTLNGFEKVVSVKATSGRDVYDIYDVEDCHNFIGNGIVNHNCHLMEPFWASVFPIVSSSKKAKVFMCSTPNGTGNLFYDIYTGSLESKNGWANDKILWNEIPGRDEKWVKEIKGGLASEEKWSQEFECMFLNSGTGSMGEDAYNHMKSYISEPVEILMNGKYKIFEHYQEDRIYVAGVDTAEGLGGDYSCVKIIDITDLNEIVEVAEYYDNTIPVSEFANKVYEILCHWGKPLACIERNNQGGQVADRLGLDMGYMDKIVCWGSKLAGRKNSQLLGMIASRNTKYNAVANARYYYNDKMVVQFRNDDSLMEVFKDFVKLPNDSWGAVSGKHDDRTMALIWALMVLHDDIVEQYFVVDEYDDCGKPSKITPSENLFKSFEPATSIYTNEYVDGIENSQIAPIHFGTVTQQASEFSDLQADGWTPLNGDGFYDIDYGMSQAQSDFISKYF